MEFEKAQRVIWDSCFGYEIGYFVGEGNQYHTYEIDMVSGVCQGKCSHSKDEIKPYSDELIYELTKRYGYTKIFSNLF